MDDHSFFRLITSLSSAIYITYNGTTKVKCPHCDHEKELPVLRLEDIVIFKCVQCQGYVLPFGGELLPLKTGEVENADEAEIKFAVTQAIMKLLYKLIRKLVWEGIGEEPIEPDDLPDTLEDLLEE